MNKIIIDFGSPFGSHVSLVPLTSNNAIGGLKLATTPAMPVQ